MDVSGSREAGDGTGSTRLVHVLSPAATEKLRASVGPRQGEVSSPAPLTAEITAELPVVGAPIPRGERRTTAVQVIDPPRAARLPAPFLLRLIVWLLGFVLLLGLVGLAVERVHPTWLDFARRSVAATSKTASTNATTASGSTSSGFRLVASQGTGARYDTGTTSYRIVLRFSHPVWTVIASPAGSQHFLVQQTLEPSASPKTVLVHGSASVQLSAATTSISVVAGGRVLGVIADPAVEGVYTFQPSGR